MVHGEGMRVLVVEDEPRMAALLRRGLERRGHATDLATTGEDAGWMALSVVYEAIVLDVMLPGKSGIDFLSELRSTSEPTPPVVVVSAWQSPADERAALGAGADAFIGKPFDPEDLAAVVEGLIAA